MRSHRDILEGLGDEADIEGDQSQEGTTTPAAQSIGWDDEELQEVQLSTFLAVRDLARSTGVLSGMKAEHWAELCEAFTPSAHLHEQACKETAARSRWPPEVAPA